LKQNAQTKLPSQLDMASINQEVAKTSPVHMKQKKWIKLPQQLTNRDNSYKQH